MKVVSTPQGVALIYEWDNHIELRAVLDYLTKNKPYVKPYETVSGKGMPLSVNDVEDTILARLSYLPQRKRLK